MGVGDGGGGDGEVGPTDSPLKGWGMYVDGGIVMGNGKGWDP
jgi:hypothetical protein